MRPTVPVLAFALLLASPATPAIFLVDVLTDGTDADPGDGDCNDGSGNCPLRAAVQEANALAGPDTVVLTDGIHALTLKRDTDQPDDETGDLDVTDEISVLGDGAESACDGTTCTAIDARRAKDRAFDVHPGGDLLLGDLSVLNGKAAKDDFNASQLDEVSGGCIRSEGELHLENVVVERCKSPDDGGCIGLTDGSNCDLFETFLDRCKTKDSGGGIEADLTTVLLERVTIANSKSAEGGGIEATGGTLELRNLTLSRNKAKLGGGLFVESETDVLINNSTFFDNKSKEGASIDAGSQAMPVALSNSLLRASGKELNCLGPITSAGGNLENGLTCPLTQPTDCSDCDPSIVSDLLDNGGFVPTHAIDAESEAIDNGVNATCEGTDARGAGRAGTCDSGAFEFNGAL